MVAYLASLDVLIVQISLPVQHVTALLVMFSMQLPIPVFAMVWVPVPLEPLQYAEIVSSKDHRHAMTATLLQVTVVTQLVQ